MPTVSSDSTLDSFSYSANDAFTINSGVTLRVTSDSKTTGTSSTSNYPYWGNTTCAGTIRLDANVIEITVASTTNAAIGQTLTGSTSGATGVITQIDSTNNKLKLRDWSAIQFSNGEPVTHSGYSSTVNSAPALSTLTFLLNTGTSITGSGLSSKFQTYGSWKELGKSDGTASQSFTHWQSVAVGGVWVQRGNPCTFTNGSAVITSGDLHQWAVGDIVVFNTTGTLPSGFTANTPYYVASSDWTGYVGTFGTTYTVSATYGGTAITAGSAGSGTHSTLASGPTFTVTSSGSTLTTPSNHNRSVGDVIVFKSSNSPYTLPSPLNVYQPYYVVATPTATTLQVSLIEGGSAITFTGTGSGTHSFLPEDAFHRWLNIIDRALTSFSAHRFVGIFCKQTANSATITFGDGTNGTIPPLGAIIRVPNITLGYTTSATAPTPQTGTKTGLNGSTQPAIIDIAYANCSWFTITTKYCQSVSFKRSTLVLDSSVFQSSGPTQVIEVCSSTPSTNALLTAIGVNNPTSLVMKKVAAMSMGATGSPYNQGAIILYSLPVGHVVQDVLCAGIGGSSSIVGAYSLVKIQRLTCIGAQFAGTAVQTYDITDAVFTSNDNSTSISQPFKGGVGIGARLQKARFLVSLNREIFSIDSGYATYSFADDCGNYAASASAAWDGANAINTRISNTWITSGSNSFINNTSNGVVNARLINCGNYNGSLTVNFINTIAKAYRASSVSKGSGLRGTHWIDTFSSATVGRLELLLCPVTTFYYSQSFYTQAGADPTFPSTGAISLQATTQSVTYETPWFIQGHTAISSVTISGTNVSNHTINYQIDTGSGYGSSKTLNTSNISAETITASTGFRLKVTIAVNTASSSNQISGIVFATTSTANAQTAINYPLSYCQPVATNLTPGGSGVALIDNSGNYLETALASASSYSFRVINFTGSPTYSILLREFGYLQLSQSVPLSDDGITNPFMQLSYAYVKVADSQVTGTLAAANALTNVSLNSGTQTVTVSANATTQDIRNKSKAFLVQNMSVADFASLTSTALTLLWSLTISSGVLSGVPLSMNNKTLTLASGTSLSVAFSSNGITTLQSNGTYNSAGTVSGGTVNVVSGTTDLSTWSIANSTINNTSASAATVILGSAPSNITTTSTGGGSITLAGNCTFQLTGLTSGASVALLDNTGAVVQSATATGSTYTFNAITFTSALTYTVRVRLYGYFESNTSVVLDYGINQVPIALTANSFITQSTVATVAAYTGIAINYGTSVITQTVSHSRAELYDYAQYSAALLANIGYATPISTTNGTDLSLIFNYTRNSCALTGTGSLSLPTKAATITGDSSTGQLPVTDSSGLRFRVYGLPTVSGSNPVLRSKRISNSTITNPTVNSNGESYFVIALGENYELRGDAIGYNASGFVVINSNTNSSVQISLNRVVDSSGNPVYGNGAIGEKALISFNPSTLYITIGYSSSSPTISAYSAFDKLEEILASSLGLEFTAHPIWDNGAIEFPRDIVSGATNPAKIQADSGNTGIPELLFQLIHDGYATPYRLIDSSNGKDIWYPTTVNIAQGSGLTAQQTRDAMALATTATIATGSIDNKISAIPTTTAPTAAAIRSEIDSNSTQLTALTGRLTSTRAGYLDNLTNLDATVSSRLAAAGYSTPPTASAITSAVWANATRELTSGNNIVLAKGTGVTGLNDITAQSVLSLATSAQTTSGTVGKLLVDNINAPVGSIPTNPLLTNDSRLNNLDASISSRSTYAGSDTSGTTTLLSRLTATRAGYLDSLTNLDASISSRLSGSSYTAPDNSSVGAIKTQTDKLVFTTSGKVDATAIGVPTNPLLTNDSRLNNLDAAISSRLATSGYTTPPTVTQIWTGFTSGTVAANLVTQFQAGLLLSSGYTVPANSAILSAIGAIPTNPVLTNDSRIALLPGISSDSAFSRKFVKNRYTIDKTANTGTLFDDDKSTPIVIFDLKDDNGNPAHINTYDKIPR